MSASGSKGMNPAVAALIIVVVLVIIAAAYYKLGGVSRREPNKENIMKHMQGGAGGKMTPMNPAGNTNPAGR